MLISPRPQASFKSLAFRIILVSKRFITLKQNALKERPLLLKKENNNIIKDIKPRTYKEPSILKEPSTFKEPSTLLNTLYPYKYPTLSS